MNGLTVKSASHDVDIQKNSDLMRKMEKQRNQDEQNWKAQMDAVHDVLDTKVNEKPFEDLTHCVASLTKGVVKFAQVVGVFPGPRFDDAEGADASEADIELLGWEDCAENMSFRIDKARRGHRGLNVTRYCLSILINYSVRIVINMFSTYIFLSCEAHTPSCEAH